MRKNLMKVFMEVKKAERVERKAGELVVNADGWYGEVLGYSSEKNRLCPGAKQLKVKVLGYTSVYKPEVRWGEVSIGEVKECNEFQFKSYPEYIGIECGAWVKA